jgi:hypothetical protein
VGLKLIGFFPFLGLILKKSKPLKITISKRGQEYSTGINKSFWQISSGGSF